MVEQQGFFFAVVMCVHACVYQDLEFAISNGQVPVRVLSSQSTAYVCVSERNV